MTEHAEAVRIDVLAAELLDQARGHSARRSARALVTGTAQRATLMALAEGAEVAEHDAPPAATLYVVTGRVRLHTHQHEWTLEGGDLIAIPPERHGLRALTDAAVLLTAALR